jgi:PPOX class probable F420-dependent enzyme
VNYQEFTLRRSGIDLVTGQRAVMLTTFRTSGKPVPTPVGYGVDGADLVYMTDSNAGKVKRLRRSPQVTVAACTLRGALRGPEVRGRARELVGGDATRATASITSTNRLAWFLLLRRARRQGRTWTVFAVELEAGGESSYAGASSVVQRDGGDSAPSRGRVRSGLVAIAATLGLGLLAALTIAERVRASRAAQRSDRWSRRAGRDLVRE